MGCNESPGLSDCLIGEVRKSTWLWGPLHQVKRIRGFTAHLAKSTPTCCDRVWVESHSGKKPVSFGHHKGSRSSRTTCDQVLCPANVHLPGPVVSEVPLKEWAAQEASKVHTLLRTALLSDISPGSLYILLLGCRAVGAARGLPATLGGCVYKWGRSGRGQSLLCGQVGPVLLSG